MYDNQEHYHNSDRFPSRDTLQWLNSLENVRNISADYTVDKSDDVIIVDTTSGDVTVTLPTAINGRKLLIINDGANDVDVDSVVTLGEGSFVLLKAYAEDWLVIGLWKDITKVSNTWGKAQYGTYVNLTSSSASIAINLALSNNFKHTLTEITTLAAPSNAVAGQAGVIEFTQHASSPKTLAFNAFWKWPGGTDGVLTATNSAIDVLSYVVDSTGTFATCVMLGDIK